LDDYAQAPVGIFQDNCVATPTERSASPILRRCRSQCMCVAPMLAPRSVPSSAFSHVASAPREMRIVTKMRRHSAAYRNTLVHLTHVAHPACQGFFARYIVEDRAVPI
jgi:hypothetical protein